MPVVQTTRHDSSSFAGRLYDELRRLKIIDDPLPWVATSSERQIVFLEAIGLAK